MIYTFIIHIQIGKSVIQIKGLSQQQNKPIISYCGLKLKTI